MKDSTSGGSRAEMMSRMLAARRIAIVGLSDDPSRPSYGVARYLLSVGKEIIPINPGCSAVLNQRCFPSLEEAPGPVELVDVFRRAEFCPDIVRSAIAIGAPAVWLQLGVVSDEAAKLAREAGLDFVDDACLKIELIRRAGGGTI